MTVFHQIEFDANTGRHRLIVINQQADHLAFVAYDESTDEYVYEPQLDAGVNEEQKAQAVERARTELPKRDRSRLEQSVRDHLIANDGLMTYAAACEAMPGRTRTEAKQIWRRTLHEDPKLAFQAHERLREALALGHLEPRPRVLCEDVISELGFHRFGPALPTLATLWADGQRELRIRAGLALLAYRTDAAFNVLTRDVASVQAPWLRTVIVAHFSQDPKQAYDRLAPHWRDDNHAFLLAVLDVLCRDYWDAGRTGTSHGWFEADKRWRELFEPLARRSQKTSTTEDPALEQIAGLAYELVHRIKPRQL